MLTAQRMAVVNSRCLRAHKLANSGGTIVTPEMEVDVITWKEALWLATAGGAAALDMSSRVGTFAVGKEFDALLVDSTAAGGPFDVFGDENDELAFEKFLNLGDDRNLAEVYVAGVCVKRGDDFLLEPALARSKALAADLLAKEEAAAKAGLPRTNTAPNMDRISTMSSDTSLGENAANAIVDAEAEEDDATGREPEGPEAKRARRGL